MVGLTAALVVVEDHAREAEELSVLVQSEEFSLKGDTVGGGACVVVSRDGEVRFGGVCKEA